ncbi:NUDIX domain-containing protein [Patescibacteria group bacterium]|nr:NUDIX domain-containing protein [Patescibacteria group bacterium]
MRLVSLLFIVDGDKVLLAKKKTRFGVGYWNGYGGGVEEGETIEESACRELFEECGLTTLPENLIKVARVKFHFEEKPEYNHDVHVFISQTFSGTPIETREMGEPQWHNISELPIHEMWPSDPYWVPLVLQQGKKIEAECIFTGSEKPFPVGKFEYKEL